MTITPDFIRTEIAQQSYEISVHADNERLADGFMVSQLEVALSRCEVLESYPDDPRGESCLVLGFAPDDRIVHIVCGRNRSGHLVLITVYLPTMPKWRDPRTRNR
jgi:hypothetical protein